MKFPGFTLHNRNFPAETSSPQTRPTAIAAASTPRSPSSRLANRYTRNHRLQVGTQTSQRQIGVLDLRERLDCRFVVAFDEMADCDMHTKSRVGAFLGRGLSKRALDVGGAVEDQLRVTSKGVRVRTWCRSRVPFFAVALEKMKSLKTRWFPADTQSWTRLPAEEAELAPPPNVKSARTRREATHPSTLRSRCLRRPERTPRNSAQNR